MAASVDHYGASYEELTRASLLEVLCDKETGVLSTRLSDSRQVFCVDTIRGNQAATHKGIIVVIHHREWRMKRTELTCAPQQFALLRNLPV